MTIPLFPPQPQDRDSTLSWCKYTGGCVSAVAMHTPREPSGSLLGERAQAMASQRFSEMPTHHWNEDSVNNQHLKGRQDPGIGAFFFSCAAKSLPLLNRSRAPGGGSCRIITVGPGALRVSKTKRRKLPAQIGSNIRFNEEENTICSFGKWLWWHEGPKRCWNSGGKRTRVWGQPPSFPWKKRQLATFRPANNFVGRASGQQERPSVACMSSDIQVHTSAGLQGALVRVWGQCLEKCLAWAPRTDSIVQQIQETGPSEGELWGITNGAPSPLRWGHGCDLTATSASVNHSWSLLQVPMHSEILIPTATQ